MAVSQKQIAEKLGVSIALVSRVLSGRAQEIGIAPATIARVMQTAQDMGYVPSAAALTLKGKATRTIGVVVYDFNDPFFGSIIEQLQAQAHKHGYSLVLAGFRGRHPAESDLHPLHKHAIDGLIVLGSDDHADWLSGFKQLPVARIGHAGQAEPSVRISIDEHDATGQLVGHLKAAGCRRFCFIGQHLTAHKLRLRALEKHAADEGCGCLGMLSHHSAFEAGQESTRTVLRDDPAVDALVCATDLIAMGALHALHDTGRRLAVTGFDDIPAASQFIPPITTFRQPVKEMAVRAFNAVIEPAEPAEICLPGRLIERSSS
jgi:LacI family transcriptional regulator